MRNTNNLHLLLLCLILCLHSKCNVQGIGLGERYALTGPTFEFDSLRNINMDFIVSDFIKDSFVGYTLYDGFKCKSDDGGDTDITDNSGYLLSRLRTDLTPISIDGSGKRTVKVNLRIDSSMLVDSSIYNDKGDNRASVEFCLRMSVYNKDKDSEDSREVNFLENLVTLDLNLSGDITLDVQLAGADRVVQQAYQDIAAEAYLCDSEDNTVAFVEGQKRSQGQTVRICVGPNPDAISDGAYMKAIEDFTFYRDDITQVAVELNTGGVAANQLTVVSCQSGSIVCAFETLLNADFFKDGAGIVSGSGSAFLELGGNDKEQESVGRTRTRIRKLQAGEDYVTETADDLLAKRATKYQIKITLLPVVKMDFQEEVSSGATATQVLAAAAATTTALLFSVISLFYV